jgi:hypothetical protein
MTLMLRRQEYNITNPVVYYGPEVLFMQELKNKKENKK